MSTRSLIVSILGSARMVDSPVGSRVTCNPAPTDTDEDWLVLVKGDVSATMQAAGFLQDGSPEFYTEDEEGGFRSYKRGMINIITTESIVFYHRFMVATNLAKKFNLLNKADRVALFQGVLYGVER